MQSPKLVFLLALIATVSVMFTHDRGFATMKQAGEILSLKREQFLSRQRYLRSPVHRRDQPVRILREYCVQFRK